MPPFGDSISGLDFCRGIAARCNLQQPFADYAIPRHGKSPGAHDVARDVVMKTTIRTGSGFG